MPPVIIRKAGSAWLQAKPVVYASIFPLFTILSLFFKSLFLFGITLDKNRSKIYFIDAWERAWDNLPFYFGFLGVLAAISFLFRGRKRLWFLTGFNLILSIILLIDLWYFRGFSTIPTLNILRQGSNLTNMSDSILAMVKPVDFLFIIDILVSTALLIILRKRINDIKRNFFVFAFLLIISLGCIMYAPSKNLYSGYNAERSILYRYDSTVTCYNLSPLGYHLYSIYAFIESGRSLKLSDKDRQEIGEWLTENTEILPPNKYKGLMKGKNLIVIQVESLEKFVINKKINGQEITPNLNRFIKNSLYFNNFYEQTNQGNSSDADLMTNTSVYPIRDSSTFFNYPQTSYISFPKLLKSKGYSTLAIHPDEGSFWNWMVSLNSIGFEKCMDLKDFDYDDFVILGLSDRSFLRQVEPVIQSQKQPFYSFMVTLSNHTPFNIAKYHRELNLDSQFDKTYLGGYFQSVHYTDKNIGILMEKLDRSGMLDNSTVVFYGDHEGVHKYFPEEVSKIQPSEDWWMDNNKQIPLIIYQKTLKGEEISTIGGQIDIMPTLLYLLGVDEKDYAGSCLGRNLLNTNKSFAVLRDGTYVGDRTDKKAEEHAVKGLEIADRIIKGNYFSN